MLGDSARGTSGIPRARTCNRPLESTQALDDDIYGLMTSHPAACLAAAKAFGSKRIFVFVVNLMLNVTGSINTVRLNFIKELAEEIMTASPIRYVKEAKLRGTLFNPEDSSGACVEC